MEVFVARQPIFDRNLDVYGYELLFRSSHNNFYDGLDENVATSSVISSSLSVIGLENLTGSKRAFINFPYEMLIKEVATTLPKESVVIEVLENVYPDYDIINACKKLKQLGYILALDDFVLKPEYRPLIELADIIKVDFLLTRSDERKSIMTKINSPKIKFLAEKVENKAEYDQAFQLGYSYFQGYFLSKPVIIKGVAIQNKK
jgi:EAL and modified HD-GYP domain-containing signal transduction protein